MPKLNNETLSLVNRLKNEFNSKFGKFKSPTLSITPISLILLGDHTQYNDGMLLSTTLDRYAVTLLRKRDDNLINFLVGKKIHKITKEIKIENHVNNNWIDEYIYNLIKYLQENGLIKAGFDFTLGLNIPKCLGLGSYAAVSASFLKAFSSEFGIGFKEDDIISIAQETEKKIIGEISNKAHHNTAVYSSKNSIIKTDLRSVKLDKLFVNLTKYNVVVCDTGIEIEHSEELCNERIKECRIGVKGLRLYIWGIRNLRDVKLDFLEKHIHVIPYLLYKRCVYNVQENIRVKKATDLIRQKELKHFGQLLFDSHFDLSANYEISSEELDFIIKQSKLLDGVIGGKMISCSSKKSVFLLVEKKSVEKFCTNIRRIYKNKFKKKLNTLILNFT